MIKKLGKRTNGKATLRIVRKEGFTKDDLIKPQNEAVSPTVSILFLICLYYTSNDMIHHRMLLQYAYFFNLLKDKIYTIYFRNHLYELQYHLTIFHVEKDQQHILTSLSQNQYLAMYRRYFQMFRNRNPSLKIQFILLCAHVLTP